MVESRPKELEEAKPDFSEPKEIYHKDHLKILNKAKAFVADVETKKATVEIKIDGCVIKTTCPEKWAELHKVHLRGNAIKKEKKDESI